MLGELAPLDLAAHLGVQAAHRRERRVVEILSVHERPHDGAQRFVLPAGEGARLDPGVALPFAPLAHEIRLEEIEAANERAGLPVGAKPQVDAKDEAVFADLGKQAHQPPRRGLERLRPGVAGMQQHEVDVGRNVELAPAELAHGDHHQVFAFEMRERGGERHFREIAHRPANLFERRRARHVARHDAQDYPLAQAPQPALERRLVVGARALERAQHLGAGEGSRCGDFGSELAPRADHARGEARERKEVD